MKTRYIFKVLMTALLVTWGFSANLQAMPQLNFDVDSGGSSVNTAG
ncbi:hypothetical protein [Alkalimarinus coralli]|nr:hypothetical protein [Alkalimarinus coralli]